MGSTFRGVRDPGEAPCHQRGTTRTPSYDSMADVLLRPFSHGSATVVTRVHDWETDHPNPDEATAVPPVAVLIVDGVFLLRPELRSWWDLAVYVHVTPEQTLGRASVRDVGVLGSADEVRLRYEHRYLPARQIYENESSPLQHAHVVIDNGDLKEPVLLRNAFDSERESRGR